MTNLISARMLGRPTHSACYNIWLKAADNQRNIVEAPQIQEFKLNQKLVDPLLRRLKCSCQANRKTRETR